MSLPKDARDRKAAPVFSGVLAYFPDALIEIARVSKAGNDQHNPGQPLHWAKEKSTDEPDALVRHLLRHGTRDSDGQRHSAKVAWRALALLQREIDAEAAATCDTRPPCYCHVRDTKMTAQYDDVTEAWKILGRAEDAALSAIYARMGRLFDRDNIHPVGAYEALEAWATARGARRRAFRELLR